MNRHERRKAAAMASPDTTAAVMAEWRKNRVVLVADFVALRKLLDNSHTLDALTAARAFRFADKLLSGAVPVCGGCDVVAPPKCLLPGIFIIAPTEETDGKMIGGGLCPSCCDRVIDEDRAPLREIMARLTAGYTPREAHQFHTTAPGVN